MTKKRAIILVLAAEAIIYLGLLVGWPMLVEAIYSAGIGTDALDIIGEMRNNFGINKMWLLYLLPGLFGAAYIILILRQKETKKP